MCDVSGFNVLVNVSSQRKIFCERKQCTPMIGLVCGSDFGFDWILRRGAVCSDDVFVLLPSVGASLSVRAGEILMLSLNPLVPYSFL